MISDTPKPKPSVTKNSVSKKLGYQGRPSLPAKSAAERKGVKRPKSKKSEGDGASNDDENKEMDGAKQVKDENGVGHGETGLRFTSSEDMELLVEVAYSKPFLGSYKEVPKNWEKAYTNLNWKRFSAAAIRRRILALREKFRAKDAASLKR